MEEFDIIETPENVNLRRRLAGIGSRFLAGILDTLLIAGMYLVLWLVFIGFTLAPLGAGSSLADAVGTVTFAILILVAFFIYWGYFILFETWLNGQTPGKRYMKIRVVQQEGAGVTLEAVVIRNLLRVVDILGLYAVAGISMFVTTKIQRLGDLAAGTVVVSEELQDYAAHYDKKKKLFDNAPVPADHLAAAGLKPQEYRLLQNYWLRRHELSFEARERLLPELLQPILDRTGASVPNQSLPALEDYVDDLLRQASGTAPETPASEHDPKEHA